MLALIIKLFVAALVSGLAMFVVALCRAARMGDDASEAWAARRALAQTNKHYTQS